MRVASAASIKGRGNWHRQQIPREGTRIRALYDLLMSNKGRVVNQPLSQMFQDGGCAIEQLRNTYGLDIRKIEYGQWLLAGEWFGRVYIDYVAERMEAKQ